MSMFVPDHPDIEWCALTGYPRDNQPITVYCEVCGEEIDGDIYEDDAHERLCEYCLLRLHKKE